MTSKSETASNEPSLKGRQIEDRALHELRCSDCLLGADYYAIDPYIVVKTLSHHGWREPTRRTANVQQAMTGLDKVGALFHATYHAHL